MTYKAFEVPEAGIEPALPQWKQDFKSCVSTNFTTQAVMFCLCFAAKAMQMYII